MRGSRNRGLGAAFVAGALCLAALTACGSEPSPAGAEKPISGAGCTQHGSAGSYRLRLTLSPCPVKAGTPAQAEVRVEDSGGRAVTGGTVTLKPHMTDMGMPSVTVKAVEHQGGYSGQVILGMAGTWQLTVGLRQSAQPTATARFEVKAT